MRPDDGLRELALQGRAAQVRAWWDQLLPADRRQVADPVVLRQLTVGCRDRLRALGPAGSPEHEAERAVFESVVQLFVAACVPCVLRPRALFETLLDWLAELQTAARFDEAETVCSMAQELGAGAHPDLGPWFQVEAARVAMLRGRADEAYERLANAWRRRDRIADRRAAQAVLDLLGTAALQTGHAAGFHRVILDRVRAFHTSSEERRAAVELMRRANRNTGRLLGSRAIPLRDRALWLLHRACLGSPGAPRGRRSRRALERISHGLAYADWYVLPRRREEGPGRGATDRPRVLVTRAMGGIGDLLMMTPALHQLALAQGPVSLAIPRRYFPVFEGNTDVALLDIDGALDLEAYERWYNLTDCPAARVESRTAPAVRLNRIELFARGLGLSRAQRLAMDRRPRYHVHAREVRERDEYLRDAFGTEASRSRPLVGVQPHTDESYRDLPHMPAIVDALAAAGLRVLVLGPFAGERLARPCAAGVHQAVDLNLRRALALAAACDVLVTPDSAFFHAAAALDRPAVGLFGPTDGRVRGADYPRARALDARRTLPCVPCWRNERMPCGLTGLQPSACLGEIRPQAVVDAVLAACGAGARGADR